MRGPSFRLLFLSLATACASGGMASPPDAEGVDACAHRAELCNGVDDDCDGAVDEDWADLFTACTVGTGVCEAPGMVRCNDAGDAVFCDARSGTPDGELCNGLDDDCDGEIDEGFGLGEPCDGDDSDACAEGVFVCMNDAAVCDDTTSDSIELCNGLDDDCRNGVDDPWPIGDACTVGIGACARTGAWQCSGATTAACSATPGAPAAETCGDGIDQDCNGADAVCPVNDRPSGAINISAGGTFTVDLSAAHNDHTVGTCGNPGGGGRDVYYRFTLPAAEVVYFDTFGSNFDTVLRLYSGTCTALDDQIACNDDSCASLQSQLTASLTAGNYCLIVDQFSSSQTNGALTLRFVRGGRTGTPIAPGTSTRTGNTCNAGNATTPASCGAYNHSAHDQAYYFTMCPADARQVDANTCTGTGWDSVVYLRQGSATSTDVRCNDDSCGLQSRFDDAPIAGANLYWLIVDGYQAACGAYTLSYSM
jgi:hypothetical protein